MNVGFCELSVVPHFRHNLMKGAMRLKYDVMRETDIIHRHMSRLQDIKLSHGIYCTEKRNCMHGVVTIIQDLTTIPKLHAT